MAKVPEPSLEEEGEEVGEGVEFAVKADVGST